MKACPYCAEQIQDAAIKCRHCGSDLTQPAGSPEPTAPSAPPRKGLATAGGALVIVAPFLPWLHVAALGNLSLFQATALSGHGRGLAWVVVGIGVAAILASRASHSAMQVLAIVLAFATGGYNVLLLVAWTRALRDTYGLVSVGIGPWVAVAGSAAIAIGAYRVRARRGI